MSNPITNPSITQLSRRELFAAMAMNSLDIGAMPPGEAAKHCVAYADALIAELGKGKAQAYGTNEYERGTLPCVHAEWTDMEHGLGQCKNCLAFLPYAELDPTYHCSHHFADVGDGIMACAKCNYRG